MLLKCSLHKLHQNSETRLTGNQREGRDLQRLLRQAKQDHLALGLEQSEVRVHGHACRGRVYNAVHCALRGL